MRFTVTCFLTLVCFNIGSVQGQPSTNDKNQAIAEVAAKLPGLKSVVDSEPNNISARALYAQALYQVENLPASWEHLSLAYKLDPKHAGVQIGIQQVFSAMKMHGLFSVNTPETTVRSLLGDPHKTVTMPWGVRHVYAFMAIDFQDGRVHETIDLRGATKELFEPAEIVDCELDGGGWRVGLRQKSSGTSSANFFLPGETISNWTQMVTIERILNAAEIGSIQRLIPTAIEQVKTKIPETNHEVLGQDATSAIIRFNFADTDGQEKRTELVRYILSSKDAHRLSYLKKGDISKEDNEKWQRILLSAKLKNVSPPIQQTQPPSSKNDPTIQNAIVAIAEDLKKDLALASKVKPDTDQLNAIAATPEDLAKLVAYCERVYSEIPSSGSAAKADQSEVLVFGPSLAELPGGYRSKIKHFKPEAKFYGFKYVAPGEKLGMSYDGLFQVEGKWFFLPKAWRAFDN